MKLSKKAQESIDRVIEKVKTGDLSEITDTALIKLDKSAPAAKWSLSNRLLAFYQAEELDCRGFKQWQTVDRKVKKGSKAVYIFRPKTIKKDDEQEDEQKTICIGFALIPVFPASATTGDKPLPAYEPVNLPPLFEVAKKLNIKVDYLPLDNHILGNCEIDGSKIKLATHDERVFFHELAHAVDAKINGKLKGGQTAEQEITAEFTSAVLMDFYNLADNTGNMWQYIKHYSDDPLTAIGKSCQVVEKILKFLIESSN